MTLHYNDPNVVVVKDTQANAFDKDIDIATLTVGGNDIGFANLINNCIFQFWITKSCQDQINEAAANIASQDFHTNLDKLAFEILQKAGAPQFKLYWTGYAHFWNQDTTQCDDVTWSYWTRDNPPKLTQDLRRQLNDLTSQLNGAIKDAVDRANSNDPRKPVVYVDYTNSFSTHRYCEDGVTEPDPNRADTWFFEWDTTEAYTVTESHAFPQGSLEKQIQDWIDQQAAADGSLKPASQGSHWIADSLAKIFHPRIDGHNAIKDAVLASYAANPPSNPWGNYVPGWCGIHVVQYQKNEAKGPNAGGPNYLLDVNIYDARQNLINADPPGSGSGVRFVALTNVPQTVDSALPLGLNITVGAVDDDAVSFQYGDQNWGSNDQAHHSNFGSYDSGSRSGDTGFNC